VPAPLPPGYDHVHAAGVEAVALDSLRGALAAVLARGTLYEYASACRDRRELVGRGPVYAVTLGNSRVVVRRARHGGLLAPLTRDLFVRPTRAPHELAVSTRLRAAGVATPAVVAYVVYHIGPWLARSDVVTEEVPEADDLLTVLRPTATEAARAAAWTAAQELVEALGRAGAVHPDLNVKNILIAHAGRSRPVAYALDVDRVVWRRPGDPAVVRANLARLRRSALKRGLR
jgi:hypothetical protein